MLFAAGESRFANCADLLPSAEYPRSIWPTTWPNRNIWRRLGSWKPKYTPHLEIRVFPCHCPSAHDEALSRTTYCACPASSWILFVGCPGVWQECRHIVCLKRQPGSRMLTPVSRVS